MRWFTPLRRVRSRSAQRQQLNAPDLSRHVVDPVDDPAPTVVEPRDWPAIESRHPAWWLVHRVEVAPDGARRLVLIAECRTEDQAFAIAVHQASQVCITKHGSKLPPYYSHRSPRAIQE